MWAPFYACKMLTPLLEHLFVVLSADCNWTKLILKKEDNVISVRLVQMDGQSSKQYFKAEGVPRLYDILEGTVSRIQPYGAFIKFPGMRKDGLVHRSQISNAKVEDPSEVLTAGESVQCKVISIEDGGEKIGLSMKLVNQTTGKDLDPNNVQSSIDAQKRKQGHSKEINKIELDAIYNTTCKKCGGKGHLAQDCFHQAGGSAYELLPDVEDSKSSEPQPNERKPKKKDHKHKKEKKKKKKKKKLKQRSSSSSDSEDDRKMKSKKKKHRKRQNSSSSSSSDSEKESRHRRHSNKDEKKRHHRDSSSDSDHHRKKHKSNRR